LAQALKACTLRDHPPVSATPLQTLVTSDPASYPYYLPPLLCSMQQLRRGSAVTLVALLALASLTPAVSKGFLVEQRKSSVRGGGLDGRALERDLSAAMGEAMGCGGHVAEEHLVSLQAQLEPVWRTLPKTAEGNVERRSLRYLIHRHFSRRSALHIRGFEPSRPANSSGWGSADILSQKVPAFVESVLESSHKLERGFNLADAARVVATIEQLIYDFEGSVLEKVYGDQHKPLTRSLSHQGVEQLLESYMVRWMLGDDEEGISILLSNRSLLESAVPHWDQIVAFTQGRVKALDYERQHTPSEAFAAAAARPGHNALAARYSFEDVHGVVGGITKSFASFWESECTSMKSALVAMDTHGTGRVPLSKFYSSALDTEWRFGESESYLRELGALDETSWRGKQVIIPNYIQAASNCIISSQHYLVCCANDCEGLLEEVESKIGAPTAEPTEILALVGNMSSQTTLDDDVPPHLEGSLTKQLEQIAAAHGGRVPLHGRLFAQWLHYAFPRECPFPHMTGVAAAVTPAEYGESYVASDEEMRRHASEANASDISAAMGKEELQWMSQWSVEEELIADYTASGLRAPWERRSYAVGGAALLAVAALMGAVSVGRGKAAGSEPGFLPYHGKAHLV